MTTGSAALLTTERARDIVGVAILAASIHNTQPWRWSYSDGVLDLYADTSRQLTVADPSGRQLVVSCGGALYHAHIGARMQGLVPEITRFPDGEGSDLLARMTAAGERPPTQQERDVFAAIGERHTDRRPFGTESLPLAVVDEVRAAVEEQGAFLHSFDRRDDRIELAAMLSRSDAQEDDNPEYQAELRRWTRTDPEAVDGVPRYAVAADEDLRQSEFTVRNFDVAEEAAKISVESQNVERPAVLLIGTDTDTRTAHLNAGAALAATMLLLTVRQWAASPLGQVVDLTASRERLRIMIGGGHPQMLLRVGRPHVTERPKATPRRPIDDVLTLG
jgi:hypothetical protein